MKKTLFVLVVAVSITLVATGMSFATILGSRHDLTDSTYYTGANISACQFCHTPHLRNNPVITGAPLWNRDQGTGGFAATGGGTYQVYGSTTAGAAGSTLSGTAISSPGANSKTCLSCHDGTLGLGTVLVGTSSTIVGAEAGGTAVSISAGVLDGDTNTVTGRVPGLGTDLRQEHPVGVVYDSGTTGPGLNSTTAQIGTSNNYAIGGQNWKIYGGDDGTGTVQCGSCHDPHDTSNNPFLRDTLSSMCTDCHSTK